MTATGHALVAALIVARIPNPYIALPLAFASHFALDLIPHWDSGTHRRDISKKRLFYEASLDVALSVVSSYVLYHDVLGQTNLVLLYSAVFISQLPDWVMAPYLLFNSRNRLLTIPKMVYRLQHRLQSRANDPFFGIATQVITVIAVYILLFRVF